MDRAGVNDPNSRGGRTDEAWRAEVAREVERIIALPGYTAKLAAYVRLSATLKEEGGTLPPDTMARLLASLRAEREQRAQALRADRALRMWHANFGANLRAERERQRRAEERRMALVQVLHSYAVPLCFLAAALPFAAAPVGSGWDIGTALSVYFSRLPSTAGVVLAIVGATVAAMLTDLPDTWEGALGFVCAALGAGTIGLAVATGS